MRIVVGLLCILFIGTGITLNAQNQRIDTVYFGGKKMIRIITERGDTAYVDQLSEVTVSSKQQFASKEEYDLYMRYKGRQHIISYALEALRSMTNPRNSTEE